jgi:hypothetical protein
MMDGKMERLYEWTYRQTNGQVYRKRQTDGRTNKQMERKTDGQMNPQTDRWTSRQQINIPTTKGKRCR